MWQALSLPAGTRRLAGSVLVTLMGQCLLLSGLFLITRISVRAFGGVGFGEYQVARRTLAVVAFPLMCGLGVSIPRHIARDISDPRKVAKWLYAGGILSGVLLAVFLVLGTCASASIGRWTFGDDAQQRLVLSLLVAVTGMFCHTLASAALRGLSRFHLAAALQVVNGALVPLTGILLAAGRVERALAIAGFLWIVLGMTVLACVCRQWPRPAGAALQVRGAIITLIKFGLPRIPGDIALFGLFALPAYTAVHRHDMVGAGFISVGLSLVQAVASVFASAGFVLLPYWSRAANSPQSLVTARRRIGALVISSALVATLSVGVLQLFLRTVARLLLGALAANGLHDLRYVAVSAVPYVIYLVLRDYMDATSAFPMNAVALSGAMLVQAILLREAWLSIPSATAASFFVLGLAMVALWTASSRHLDTIHKRQAAHRPTNMQVQEVL